MYKYLINLINFIYVILLGIVITKGSKIPDQAFEFIEILINDKYPFLYDINVAITVIKI